jgi:hypothetical protein
MERAKKKMERYGSLTRGLNGYVPPGDAGLEAASTQSEAAFH